MLCINALPYPPRLCFSSLGSRAPESLRALPGNLNLLNPFLEEPSCSQALSAQGGHLTLTRTALLIPNGPLLSQPLTPNLCGRICPCCRNIHCLRNSSISAVGSENISALCAQPRGNQLMQSLLVEFRPCCRQFGLKQNNL